MLFRFNENLNARVCTNLTVRSSTLFVGTSRTSSIGQRLHAPERHVHGGIRSRQLVAETQKVLAECPITTAPTLTDVGGGRLVELAGQTIRSLRASPTAEASAIASQSMAGQEVEWFARTRQGQAALAYMLVVALATAKRWKTHDLIDAAASGYQGLVRLFVLASDVMPNACACATTLCNILSEPLQETPIYQGFLSA